MENLTHALYMAFAALVFVIAFSVSLYLVGKLNTTSKEITYSLSGEYYDSLSFGNIISDNELDMHRSRIVGIDTIIPTLYRYYKESFAVKILDKDEKLLQIFDTTTESEVNAAKTKVKENRSDKDKALLSLYDVSGEGDSATPNNACCMYGAPWLANINKDAKTRIDMYINGGKGYINNVLVDYSDNNIKNYKDKKFKETFTQYAYEGDTITDNTNGEITTLTGNKQISTKIIIIYQLLP